MRSTLRTILAVSLSLAASTIIGEDVINKDLLAKDIAVYFAYTKDHISHLELKIKQLESKTSTNYDDQMEQLASLKDSLKVYIVANLISEGNIEALKNMSREQLQFYEGQIEVEGKLFNDTGPGYLVYRAISGRNALAFVLFHSVLDKTQADKDRTLAMLQVLLDKKLNPNARAGEVLWVSKDESSTTAADYVRRLWLREVAAEYSFPEAQALLEKYSTTKTVITKLEDNIELETQEEITDDFIVVAKALYLLQNNQRIEIGAIGYTHYSEFAPICKSRLSEEIEDIISPFLAHTKNIAIICSTYIKPQYRGKNFARMLINLTCKELFEKNKINIVLMGPLKLFELSENNESIYLTESTPEYKTKQEQIIRLFESCGFCTDKINDTIITHKATT